MVVRVTTVVYLRNIAFTEVVFERPRFPGWAGVCVGSTVHFDGEGVDLIVCDGGDGAFAGGSFEDRVRS